MHPRSLDRALGLMVLGVLTMASAGAAHGRANVGEEAARLVARRAGYRDVIRDVRGWHGTLRNGCVAFVTTALRHVGFSVPDVRPEGPWSNPARVTFSLDAYLADAGWPSIQDATALRAGDVVFTTGAPDHVMLFHGWADQAALIAIVSDNQQQRYRRPLHHADQGGLAGFGFARRAPPGTPATPDGP